MPLPNITINLSSERKEERKEMSFLCRLGTGVWAQKAKSTRTHTRTHTHQQGATNTKLPRNQGVKRKEDFESKGLCSCDTTPELIRTARVFIIPEFIKANGSRLEVLDEGIAAVDRKTQH